MEAGRSRQLTDCGRFSQASVTIYNAIARNEVGITPVFSKPGWNLI
jgi:hypothetical protein